MTFDCGVKEQSFIRKKLRLSGTSFQGSGICLLSMPTCTRKQFLFFVRSSLQDQVTMFSSLVWIAWFQFVHKEKLVCLTTLHLVYRKSPDGRRSLYLCTRSSSNGLDLYVMGCFT